MECVVGTENVQVLRRVLVDTLVPYHTDPSPPTESGSRGGSESEGTVRKGKGQGPPGCRRCLFFRHGKPEAWTHQVWDSFLGQEYREGSSVTGPGRTSLRAPSDRNFGTDLKGRGGDGTESEV